MRYLLLYFSVKTFNMCFKCVLSLEYFLFPPKLDMAQLRHLEIGIDAMHCQDRSVIFQLSTPTRVIGSGLQKWIFKNLGIRFSKT